MKVIVFDFDGVIHNTFELAYQLNVQILGSHLTREEYRDFFDGNIYDRAEITKDASKEFFELQNEAFRFLKIEEKIKESLIKLAEKYLLFIISSNQKKALDIYFQNNNFTNIFKEILGLEAHKSKVEKFKFLFNEYGFGPNDCVFVTDTLGDILEGNKVGVKSIAVDFGFHGRERLEKGEPFRIVSNFDKILEVIEEM
ncbi:MAG: HAD hydrolase-like protein [archaeon]